MNTQSADKLVRKLIEPGKCSFDTMSDSDIESLIIYIAVIARSGQDTTEIKKQIDSWPKEFYRRVVDIALQAPVLSKSFWVRPADAIIDALKM